MLQVLGRQPETALLRETCIGIAIHEIVRSWLVGRTSTRSGLTPTCQLNYLLRQTSDYRPMQRPAVNYEGGH
jgi:hypothetical protein